MPTRHSSAALSNWGSARCGARPLPVHVLLAVLAYRVLLAMGASASLSHLARGQAKPGCASPPLVPARGPYAPGPATLYQYKKNNKENFK